MSDIVGEWLAAPEFEDQEKARAAKLLNTSLLAVLAVTTTTAAVSIIVLANAALLMAVFTIEAILTLGMLMLIRRGYVQITGIIFVSLFWMLPTVVAYLSGGVSTTGYSSYMTIVLMAGLLINVRAGVVFAALSSLVGLGFLYAQNIGALPEPIIPDSPEFAWIGLSANFAMVVIMVYLTQSSIRRSLGLASKNEWALAKTNQELKMNRLQLIDQTIELTQANKELKNEVITRKKAEEEKNASLREKEVLLKEIHHRVKNNLQIVSSLLYLQTKNARDEESRLIFQDSQNRIRAMSLIHEKLYQSEDLANIELEGYIHSLVKSLFIAYGIDSQEIKYVVEAKGVFLGVDLAIPCGVIINELASNALKHAFPEKRAGEIRIQVKSDGNAGWILRVQDNGIGIPTDFDADNAESLGLQLVNNLTNQLGGSMEIQKDGSADITIRFKESRERLR